MDSQNARFLRQGLIDRYRKMTPEERVKVFIEHSQLMKDLKKVGELRREAMAEAMKPKPAGSENV